MNIHENFKSLVTINRNSNDKGCLMVDEMLFKTDPYSGEIHLTNTSIDDFREAVVIHNFQQETINRKGYGYTERTTDTVLATRKFEPLTNEELEDVVGILLAIENVAEWRT